MKDFKTHATLWCLKLCGRLPLALCRSLGSLLGRCFWYFPSRTRTVTEANIAHCLPTLSPRQQSILAQHSIRHTFMSILEIAVVWHRPFSWLDKKIIHIDGKALLTRALADDRGVVFLIPHLGNWEVAGLYLAQHTATTSLYEPSKNPYVEAYVKAARQKTGAQLVPTNSQGVGKLLKHLRQGGATCILPDQVPHRKSGFAEAPFFNKPANTMTLASQLINKTNAIVLCAYAKRQQGGFALNFKIIDEKIRDNDIVISTTALNQAVEEAVREVPEQYQWEYKRFKYQQNSYKK